MPPERESDSPFYVENQYFKRMKRMKNSEKYLVRIQDPGNPKFLDNCNPWLYREIEPFLLPTQNHSNQLQTFIIVRGFTSFLWAFCVTFEVPLN